MKRKRFTHAITFPTTPEVYEALKKESDEYGMSLSELMRGLTDDHVNGTRIYARPSVEEREIEAISNEEVK